jgi:hypothetical protein
VNPRSPGTVTGTVVDSLADSTGVLHVVATSAADSSKQVLVEAGLDGAFELRLERGTWRIRAFRDLDSDRRWQPARERASDVHVLAIEPAQIMTDIRLVVRRAGGGP